MKKIREKHRENWCNELGSDKINNLKKINFFSFGRNRRRFEIKNLFSKNIFFLKHIYFMSENTFLVF